MRETRTGADRLVGALRSAVKPPEQAPAGRLTAWSPPTAGPDVSSMRRDDDGGG